MPYRQRKVAICFSTWDLMQRERSSTQWQNHCSKQVNGSNPTVKRYTTLSVDFYRMCDPLILQEPFMILPELRNDEVDVRFTRTGTAFYIISLKPPTMPSFTVEAPLPLWPGDVVSLLGSSRPVEWTSENCSTTFNLEEGEVAGAGSGIAWVIKIDYTGSARKSDKVSVHDEL